MTAGGSLPTAAADATPFDERLERTRRRLVESGIDALVVSVGADLPWLIGYEAMPLERLTAFVLTARAATLIVPALEAPRLRRVGPYEVVPWRETDDPIQLLARRLPRRGVVAIGDRMWAGFLVDLLREAPRLEFRRASEVTGPLRARKDAHERAVLARAAAAADRVIADLQNGNVPLVGRSESQVAVEIGQRLVAEGHERTNFAIVAAGANAASPHHEPGDDRIRPGQGVLFDIGGTMRDEFGVGYCSDITRCIWLGTPPPAARDAYDALSEAHRQAVERATVGTPCQAVDAAARDVLDRHGWGEAFIHRTGHGIGVEEHEDPYIVAGNREPLADGHAFSIEPGVYVPGEFGFRLEDIVVATADGPAVLNTPDRSLVILDR